MIDLIIFAENLQDQNEKDDSHIYIIYFNTKRL